MLKHSQNTKKKKKNPEVIQKTNTKQQKQNKAVIKMLQILEFCRFSGLLKREITLLTYTSRCQDQTTKDFQNVDFNYEFQLAYRFYIYFIWRGAYHPMAVLL